MRSSRRQKRSKTKGLAFERLEIRRLLAIDLGVVVDRNKELLQIEYPGQPAFEFGLTSIAKAPGGVFLNNAVDDRILVGDWGNYGFSNLMAARPNVTNVKGEIQWQFLLASDRDANVEAGLQNTILFRYPAPTETPPGNSNDERMAKLARPFAGNFDNRWGDEVALAFRSRVSDSWNWKVNYGRQTGTSTSWKYFLTAAEQALLSADVEIRNFGASDAQPVVGDFNGDGYSDLGAVKHISTTQDLSLEVAYGPNFTVKANKTIKTNIIASDLGNRIELVAKREADNVVRLSLISTDTRLKYFVADSTVAGDQATLVLNFTERTGLSSTAADSQLLIGRWADTAWTKRVGEVIGSWDSATNWTVPTDAQDVVLDTWNQKYTVTVGTQVALNRTGATVARTNLEFTGGDHVFNGLTDLSNVVVSGGSVNFAASANNTKAAIGTLEVKGSGKVKLSGAGMTIQSLIINGSAEVELLGTDIRVNELNLSGQGTFKVSARGIFSVVNQTGGVLDIAYTDKALGSTTLNISGGTIRSSIPQSSPNINVRLGNRMVLTNTVVFETFNTSYLVLEEPISGNGELQKKESGFVYFEKGTGSYTGDINVSAGTLILQGGTVARQIVVNNGVFEMYSGGTTTNLELTSSRLITHRTANFNEVTLRTGNYTLTQAINARKLTIDGGTTTLSATSTIDQLNITAGSLILEARLDAGTNLNASGNSIVQMRTAQELNGLVINNRATVQIENSAANNPFGTLASVSISDGEIRTNVDTAVVTPTNFSIPNTITISGVATLGNSDAQTSTAAQNVAIFSGIISGTGSLRKVGRGTLELPNSNTYSGVTLIEGDGVVRLRATNAIPRTGALTVNAGARLQLNGFAQSIALLSGDGIIELGGATFDVQRGEFNGTISGAGRLRKSSDGTLTLGGANDYSAPTDILAGSLVLTGINSLGTGPIDVRTGATLDARRNQRLSSLVNSGTVWANTITLSISDSFTNLATFNGVSGTIETTGTDSTAEQTLAYGASSPGNLRVSGRSKVLVAGDTATMRFGLVTLQAGTLDIGEKVVTTTTLTLDGNATLTGSGQVISTSDFVLRSGTVAVALAGNVGLRKRTAGTVTLNSTNRYEGSTVVEQGTLDVRASGGLPNTLIDVQSSGTLKFSGTQSATSISNSGTIDASTAVVRLTGNLINSNAMTLGTLQTIGPSGTVQQANIGAGSINNLTTLGPATVQLESQTTQLSLTGSLTVQAGSLDLGNKQVTANQVVLEGTNTTQVRGTGSLTSANAFDLRSGTVAVPLAGSAGLRKSTGGSVNLTVGNSYTGATNIVDNGTLNATASGALGLGNVQVATAAVLNLAGTQTVQAFANQGTVAAGSSTLRVQGDFASPGTFASDTSRLETVGGQQQRVDLGDNQLHDWVMEGTSVLLSSTRPILDLTGSLAVRAGVLDAGSVPLKTQSFLLSGTNEPTLRGAGTLTSATTYDVRAGVIAMELTGDVGLRKTSTATVRIDVPATYTGNTQVVAGLLKMNTDNALSPQTPVAVEAEGELEFGRFSSELLSLSNKGRVLIGEAELTVRGDVINEISGSFNADGATLVLGGNLLSSGSWPSNNTDLRLAGTRAQQRLRSGGAAFSNVEHVATNELILEDAATIEGEFSQTAGNVQLTGGSLSVGSLNWLTGNLSTNNDLVPHAVSIRESATFGEGRIGTPIRGGQDWFKNGTGELIFVAPLDFSRRLHATAGSISLQDEAHWPELRDLKLEEASTLTLNSGNASFANVDIAGTLNLGDLEFVVMPTERSGAGEQALAQITGTVIGNRGLLKRGNAALTWSGSNRVEGSYRILEGQLNVTGESAIARNSSLLIGANGAVRIGHADLRNVSLQGEGELFVADQASLQTTSGEFAGALRGSGTLIKAGSDELKLVEASRGDFSGLVQIEAGSISFNGTLPEARILALTGTRLTGKGTLGSVVIHTGATLSPGNSPGTMKVDSLSLRPGSTLVMELDGLQPGTAYDQIAVQGTAELLGDIRVVIADALQPFLKSYAFFDLVTFATMIGQPKLEFINREATTLLVTAVLPDVYRLVVQQAATIPLTGSPPGGSTPPEYSPVPVDTGEGPTSDNSTEREFESGTTAGGAEAAWLVNFDSSQWLDESGPLSPARSDAANQQEAAAAAMNSVIAEGLSLDLQMIASDMKPLSREELDSIPFPELRALPHIADLLGTSGQATEETSSKTFNNQLTIWGGLTTMLTGLGTMGLAITRLWRQRESSNDSERKYAAINLVRSMRKREGEKSWTID